MNPAPSISHPALTGEIMESVSPSPAAIDGDGRWADNDCSGGGVEVVAIVFLSDRLGGRTPLCCVEDLLNVSSPISEERNCNVARAAGGSQRHRSAA